MVGSAKSPAAVGPCHSIDPMGAVKPVSPIATIVQPNLMIPLDIQERIDADELYRIGGVVREIATQQIAALLDEVPEIECRLGKREAFEGETPEVQHVELGPLAG